MQQSEFERELMRLRNHFGERHYSSELAKILWTDFKHMDLPAFRTIVLESIATHSQGKPPLRDDFKEIGKRLQVTTTSSWKYFEVDDCMTCGGAGWHYAFRPDGAEGIVACDDCRAGKNMQIAPRPHINWTMAQCPGVTYSRPGKEGTHKALHPKLKARFGSWEGLDRAIREKRLTTTDAVKYANEKIGMEK